MSASLMKSLTKNSNVTTGKIYWSVLHKERRGDYGGGTVQVIPHITNEIKSRFYRNFNEDETHIAIIEVGGTVGDIESQPFLEAIRQFQHDVRTRECHSHPCHPDSLSESFRRAEDQADPG